MGCLCAKPEAPLPEKESHWDQQRSAVEDKQSTAKESQESQEEEPGQAPAAESHESRADDDEEGRGEETRDENRDEGKTEPLADGKTPDPIVNEDGAEAIGDVEEKAATKKKKKKKKDKEKDKDRGDLIPAYADKKDGYDINRSSMAKSLTRSESKQELALRDALQAQSSGIPKSAMLALLEVSEEDKVAYNAESHESSSMKKIQVGLRETGIVPPPPPPPPPMLTKSISIRAPPPPPPPSISRSGSQLSAKLSAPPPSSNDHELGILETSSPRDADVPTHQQEAGLPTQ